LIQSALWADGSLAINYPLFEATSTLFHHSHPCNRHSSRITFITMFIYRTVLYNLHTKRHCARCWTAVRNFSRSA
jgi:hypothetical protein